MWCHVYISNRKTIQRWTVRHCAVAVNFCKKQSKWIAPTRPFGIILIIIPNLSMIRLNRRIQLWNQANSNPKFHHWASTLVAQQFGASLKDYSLTSPVEHRLKGEPSEQFMFENYSLITFCWCSMFVLSINCFFSWVFCGGICANIHRVCLRWKRRAIVDAAKFWTSYHNIS